MRSMLESQEKAKTIICGRMRGLRRPVDQQTLRAVGIDGWASPVGLDNAEEDSEILRVVRHPVELTINIAFKWQLNSFV
jgi:hypothetical protein